MKIIRDISEMNRVSENLRRKNISIGFVPTMGALHEGHLRLIRAARRDNRRVIVSIFLNPAQFGPREDLKRYPRPLGRDIALCRKEGVDMIFHPSSSDMYPAGFKTFVTVEGLSEVLCGRLRPGHFRGVATVVAKLFNIIRPDEAYFGQKDFQQAVIIQQMCRDLNIPVKLKVLGIVRDEDGLALSSRNAYLDRAQRLEARLLSRSLLLGKKLFRKGVRDPRRIIVKIKSFVAKGRLAKIEYAAIVDPKTLNPVKRVTEKSVLALAVRFGGTRLIDNTSMGKNKDA